ncbi:hypothetical protein PR202_ga14300 [Eleusine coracana subsp. coracana]|uniref:1,3-beta-glucan synthase n=1 Tax=Eleusine coracana subsp. coracana TaxID=191504 RepID=A0AAV5CH32_ELECO|nr:hypothetical protein PR202_ga14300 [Eleusine coracana subsp. coracana]
MLRSRFESLPVAFNERLIPSDTNRSKGLRAVFSRKPKASGDEQEDEKAARFAQMWNLIITSFREEDLIDNREMDLLLVPYCKDRELNIFQWPPFLLASKIPIALDMAADSGGKDRDLTKRMRSDPYFSYAIRECYASFKNIINTLVLGQREKDVIKEIFDVVDKHIADGTFIRDLNMRSLPALSKKFVDLLELLQKNKEEDLGQVVILFQDMLEVVTRDIMEEEQLGGVLESIHGGSYRRHEGITPLDQQDQLFAKAIKFPVEESNAWTEKIKRLHLLLTVKDVLTPYYKEDVLFSLHNLEEPNEDGVSILFYLQKIYPDEWKNFLERVERKTEEELREDEELEEELRLWASYRGQTLTRTVRGMMYYRKALELQAFLDMAKDDDLMEGYRATELMSEDSKLMTRCKAIADLKFTYVVSCQQYGIQKPLLDIVFGWKAKKKACHLRAVKLRYVLKLVSAAAWVVILPVTYAYTWENPTGLARTIKSWLGDGQNQPSLYILAIVIYLAPNILASMLFLFPFLRRFLESSNVKVITFMMWWSQPRLFVGRGMHEGAFSLFKYTMFWVLLLAMKLTVSFYIEMSVEYFF